MSTKLPLWGSQNQATYFLKDPDSHPFFILHELLQHRFLTFIQNYHFHTCSRGWHFQLEDMATSRILNFTISSEFFAILTSRHLPFTISRLCYALTPQTDEDHKSLNREGNTRGVTKKLMNTRSSLLSMYVYYIDSPKGCKFFWKGSLLLYTLYSIGTALSTAVNQFRFDSRGRS